MSKLKFSFLVLMLMVSVSASADWAPADVQAALKKMYPTADGVAWSHDESYYVADLPNILWINLFLPQFNVDNFPEQSIEH